MMMTKKILILIAFVIACLFAQSFDAYMGVEKTVDHSDVLGD
ncbi:hypothetical protein [Acinetobacter beijerinckii]|uniref:Uncharacterized protein n=1 Tax=Acinetobacter beijerinckii CIP 110307 TaxID=1217648 RepID=N9FQY2_9GAMM|nr:hypothetical protein [Acinetobacter beijerinckii]ENW07239.1 hypothetical protein F933_01707 [Acinetobacter beijerinckii CIP 110307]